MTGIFRSSTILLFCRCNVLQLAMIPFSIVRSVSSTREGKQLPVRCSCMVCAFFQEKYSPGREREDFRLDRTRRLATRVHLHVGRERAFILCKQAGS